VIGLIVFLEHNASVSGHVPRGYVPASPGTVQRYVPGQPTPATPQGGIVTPPQATEAGSLPPNALSNPDDPEVRRG